MKVGIFVSVIYQGNLKRTSEPFEVRRLDRESLPQITDLQATVYHQLENKESLQQLSEAEYENIMEAKGILIGAFANDKLIAIRALLEPPIDEEHLGRFAGLEEEELNQVIYQEISLVHPDYRGNRLQQELAFIIMDELQQLEKYYRYVCATVAPFNIASLKDKFNQQMHVAALEWMYGEKLRYVFLKDLEAGKSIGWKETKSVPMEEISEQQDLLAAGWVGYGLEAEGERWRVRFGRR